MRWIGLVALVGVGLVGCGGSSQKSSGVDLRGSSACAENGGRCVAPSACAPGAGYLAAAGSIACGTMDAAAVVCCFPTCGGAAEEMPCCGFQLTTRPLCSAVNGSLACPTGTVSCAPDQL